MHFTKYFCELREKDIYKIIRDFYDPAYGTFRLKKEEKKHILYKNIDSDKANHTLEVKYSLSYATFTETFFDSCIRISLFVNLENGLTDIFGNFLDSGYVFYFKENDGLVVKRKFDNATIMSVPTSEIDSLIPDGVSVLGSRLTIIKDYLRTFSKNNNISLDNDGYGFKTSF